MARTALRIASTTALADSNLATVSLNVVAANDAPVAADDQYSTNEDTALTVAAPGVRGNDADVDGDPLTASVVSPPTHGTLTLNANGSFTYTPAPDYRGQDGFTYKVNDGTADSNEATVTITVVPVNDPPVAADDAYTTAEDSALTIAAPGVKGNDTDSDGDAFTVRVIGQPAHGSVALNGDGSFTYTPAADLPWDRQLYLSGERHRGGLEPGDRHHHGDAGQRRADRGR